MVIWTVAWRNVWRNKLRSLIIITAIAVGVFAGVFTTAFMKGMSDQRIESAIKTEISFIQLHNPKFKEAQDIDALIEKVDEKNKQISEIANVSGQSARIVVNGMASSAETSSGVRLYGINPDEEFKVTNINEKLIEGEFFDGIKRNPVVIGQKLAEKLNLKLRSKIIFTFQDYEGNLTGGSFRIAGIYRTDNSMFDESTIFVKKSDLQRLTMLPENTAHQIVVNLNNYEADKTVKSEIVKLFPDLDTKLWTELKPELAYLTEIMGVYMYIFVGIILFALGFGIVNTMLMVVLERVKELGMLLAVGMNKFKVFEMIVLETVFLSLTGGVIGIIIGGLISKYFSVNAIDLSLWSEGLSKIGWGSLVYTSIDFEMLISITLMVIATGILAAIYPARKALKLNPADALRTE
ncbi:MAG: ABC transporter permease [Bacteroidales bacterium]|nr:ABC transporter permease [Bacteroidales bacterium]MBN2758225.1 ABC transporter permease [Bacteroidales bacterium]